MLTLHLKRFSHVGIKLQKHSGAVTFPLELNVAPFCLHRKCELHRPKAGSGLVPKQPQRFRYKLYAVVVHIGAMQGGHYVAYTRRWTDQLAAGTGPATAPGERTTGWRYCSDSKVYPVDESEVLAAEAYLLFYSRVDAPTELEAEPEALTDVTAAGPRAEPDAEPEAGPDAVTAAGTLRSQLAAGFAAEPLPTKLQQVQAVRMQREQEEQAEAEAEFALLNARLRKQRLASAPEPEPLPQQPEAGA